MGKGGYRISTFQIYKITKLKYKTEDNPLQSTDANKTTVLCKGKIEI